MDMQPLTGHREVTSGGVTESKRFGISHKNEEHIKMLLRDAIYSDKPLAVLREYSANAWDAHRMVGKHDLPIKVTLPTWQEPVLLIEDYGPGLSHDEAFNVFTQYGDSTKRGSDDAVGMLGIGSKSGFAYSDTFTVISRHGGKKRTYVAVLDEDDNDLFNLLSEEDHDPADTGLTIQIAVRKEDIQEFHDKAVNLFQYFQPRPVINIPLPQPPKIAAKLKQGLIYDKSSDYWVERKWVAIMGCIPYAIDLDQLRGPDGNYLISENFRLTSGLLYFDIGGVQINASREALKYSKFTKEALVAKFEALLEEYVKVVLDEAESTGKNDWDKRVVLQRLLALGLGKKEIGEFGEDRVYFGHVEELDIEYGGNTILVSEESRFIRSTPEGAKRDRKGYSLRHQKDILVKPGIAHKKNADGNAFYDVNDKPFPPDVAWAALEKLIQDKKMVGVKVVNLDEIPWVQPYVPPSKQKRRYSGEYNPKHRATAFRYLGAKSSYKLSENWEPVFRRKPQPDDVFVVLEQFEVVEGGPIHRQGDQLIADYFGLILPEIYGYKSTEKKPLQASGLVGTTYEEWRKKFLAQLPADKLQALVQNFHWHQASKAFAFVFNERPETRLARIWDNLGSEHLVTKYLYKLFKSRAETGIDKLYHKLRDLGVVSNTAAECNAMLRQIQTTYPLLGDAHLSSLWKGNTVEWQRYIRLVDSEEKATLPVTLADIAVPPEALTEE